ncbi:mandelate racemase/muconate lactonizing enzyme family protein [Bradyrhizobium sp. ISRA443]|uniref:mandelate racemase/muconate lactonizing enzyme family protein n=1 Tax=unclassified Bradyrhizobium TaxID=2631580 RepID=UPI002479C7E0|nr:MULTISPECIES: mandelate racemase/muconate lactonizing enzyme family protein [unclassified Bradyrhizobium]WGR97133.1 mandelate racemase/muconate lactonizing enzyme family protein [Bradyrhizobium sp. ISRA436]WGS04021.1 mandelate racemase/muconate lactonizing enzyme family protein [Bradyrhizobium sp. ISRA437]WGS10904.1 mandelate racemase/muconate lactonizing enzyme family protein [Bradyrhizobium sp. ISRA443]
MTSQAFTIKTVQAFCYRYPLSTPVATSFGRMLSRPAVFVRAEDADGIVGWGEVWCNFPSPGAEHRVRLVNEVLASAAVGVAIDQPTELFDRLTSGTSVLALQSGEAGPFAQSIAGIDLAIWDLYARRRKTALWKLLGGARSTIKVYASGINPTGSRAMAEAALARGHRALKLKVGFAPETDRANLSALRDLVGAGLLAADANQAWSVEQALETAPLWKDFSLAWLEEPIRADRPWQEWVTLAAGAGIPLAAGENIASRTGFEQALTGSVLSVVQPDIAKWGGLSACADVAHDIIKAGKTFCPHYLGGGIGLLASAHLLAGVGGDGLLEVDANDNPLRERFCGPVRDVRDGMITLGDEPGLGIEPDLAEIEQYRTA